jgi:hypothetical protein
MLPQFAVLMAGDLALFQVAASNRYCNPKTIGGNFVIRKKPSMN